MHVKVWYLFQLFSANISLHICLNSTKTLREACLPPTTRLMLSSPPPGSLVNGSILLKCMKLITNSWAKYFNLWYISLARGWGGWPASAPGSRHLRPGPRRPRHRPHTCSPLPPGPKSPATTFIITIPLFSSSSSCYHLPIFFDVILTIILTSVSPALATQWLLDRSRTPSS